MSNPPIDFLIRVLQDKSIDIGVRDAAAMDLGIYDEPRVLEALIQTAKDAEEHEMILDSCGESIKNIWVRKGIYSRAAYNQFTQAAKSACHIDTAVLREVDG